MLAPLYAKLFMYMFLCFPLGRDRSLRAEVLVSLEWLSCTYLNISDIYTGARPFRLLYMIQAFQWIITLTMTSYMWLFRMQNAITCHPVQ